MSTLPVRAWPVAPGAAWSPEAGAVPTLTVGIAPHLDQRCQLGGYDPDPAAGGRCDQRGWLEVVYRGERRWSCSRHAGAALGEFLNEIAYELAAPSRWEDATPAALDAATVLRRPGGAAEDLADFLDRITADYHRLASCSTGDAGPAGKGGPSAGSVTVPGPWGIER